MNFLTIIFYVFATVTFRITEFGFSFIIFYHFEGSAGKWTIQNTVPTMKR
jgi:hypothetical protein